MKWTLCAAGHVLLKYQVLLLYFWYHFKLVIFGAHYFIIQEES